MSPWAASGRFLEAYREAAEPLLGREVEAQVRALASLPFSVGRYVDLLPGYVARGGKRVRGALVVLGYEAAGGTDRAGVLRASLAFELMHAFLLAFDDFMDRDEVRRGGKALHVEAIEVARSLGSADPVQRGVSANLLLGLLMQSLSVRCVTSAGFTAARLAPSLAYLNDVLEGVTVGQLLDVAAVDASSATAADVSEIHRRKTGLYTTEGPLVFGALLAGASDPGPAIDALRGWAGPAGEAFQLVDDVLGVVGDPALTGKPASGDLREGKRSSVIEAGLERASGPDADWLRSVVGRPMSDADAARARTVIVGSGAVDAVTARARSLAASAASAVAGRLAPESVAVLEGLAMRFVERNA